MSSTVLALDVGERRIGLATASAIARLPAPHGVIDRAGTSDVTAEIERIAAELGAGVVVVGLPRGLDGQETAQTAKARSFAAELGEKLGVPVVLQDEAVTSVEAEARLKARGRPYDKGDIDAEAAAMILEDYLKTTVERTA